MADMTAVNDTTMPAEDMMAPPTPAPAGGDMTAEAGEWVVGYVAATDEPVLAATDQPDDTTEVWVASTPNERQSLADMDDAMGEGGVEWLAEPEVYEPPAAVAAGMGSDMLDEVEAKIATLEGLVAGMMVDTLEDEAFADESEDDMDPMSRVMDQQARVSAMAAAARALLVGMTAAAGDAPVDATDEASAMGADSPQAKADSEAMDARFSDLMDRVQKLEDAIAKMMDESTSDAEMVSDGEESGQAVVDERPGME